MDKKVIVTANNGPGWRWTNVRNKSDRGDAAKLIKMHATDQLEPGHIPSHPVRQWRGMIRHRHARVCDRTTVRNRVIGLLTVQGLPPPKAKTPWTQVWVAEVRQHAKPLTECAEVELWRGRLHQDLEMHQKLEELIRQVEHVLETLAAKREAVAFVQQEVGVGPRLAEALVATIDDPLRFRRGKQVACYVGLSRATGSRATRSARAASASRATSCCGRCWSRSAGWGCGAASGCARPTSASNAACRAGPRSPSSRSPASC
jgi:transposase